MSLYGERFVPTDTASTFYKEHIQRYRFCKPYIRGKKVLDLGCGTGYGSAQLIKLGASTVIGVDIDPDAISFAKHNYRRKNLSFLTRDATTLPFNDASFNVVVSFEVIEHMRDYRAYLREVMRVLTPKGHFIFSTPNRNQYRAGTSPYHFKEFTAQDLQQLFKPLGSLELFGQFFTNKAFIEYEKAYFSQYTKLTAGNRVIKKALHVIPPALKSWVYKRYSGSSMPPPTHVVIKKTNLDEAITLMGVCRKGAGVTRVSEG